MRLSLTSFALLALATTSASAFSPQCPTASGVVAARGLMSSSLQSSLAAEQEKTFVIEHEHCQEPGDRDILIRAARGEKTERTPVWLMRQAGRYMAAFRAYSTKYGFRERSETPDMAVELSLQCHRKYGMDGIIMFSDILTPLPALGIDFDVVSGMGPVISTKIASEEDVMKLADANSIDFDESLPFIREILGRLSKEAEESNTALIGFVGAPFTLAAYTMEGKSSKHCLTTKKHMMRDDMGTDKTMSMFLDKLAVMIGNYASHQIDCGAQVIQLFESWAHQVSPAWFEAFAKPAAQKAIKIIKERHPNVPVIYFANGGSAYLELQRDMGADMIAIDWQIDMAQARQILGPDIPISGNIDPSILFGSKEQIEKAVRDCIDKAGGPGNKHLLNLGHGVMQGTPEEAVGWFVDAVKRYKGKQE